MVLNDGLMWMCLPKAPRRSSGIVIDEADVIKGAAPGRLGAAFSSH